MPQFEVFQDINSQEYTNFVPIPEYHDYYEEFPTVYWENTYDSPEDEERRNRDSSSDSSGSTASATALGTVGRSIGTGSRSGRRSGRSRGYSSGSSSVVFSRAPAASILAATFIALVAVAGFVLPALENTDLSVDMDVDYGGDTLTYMVSLTNASANAKYYVVVMEDQSVVYEKEIVDGYQTGIVQGLDGTKDHKVEIRTGAIPLYVVDKAIIPAQDSYDAEIGINKLTAIINTIEYDVTVKGNGNTVTLGIYPAEGEAAVFTKVLDEGANIGSVPDFLYNHEYVVKFFGEDQTYVIKAVTTDRLDSDIVITGIEGLTYTTAEKALVTKTGNTEQTVQYSIDGGSNWITTIPEFTDAGEYTVKYKADASERYKALEEGSVVVTVAKVSYDMTGASWDYVSSFTYDGNEKTVSVTGLPAGVTVNQYSNNSKTNVGDYTAAVTFNYDSTNYNEPTIADCPWAIDMATNSWTTAASIDDTTYGTAPETAGAAEYGGVTWAYYTNSACTEPVVGEITAQNVGTYYAKATVEATDNYTGLSEVLSFGITKATASVDSVTPQYARVYDTGSEQILLTVDPTIVHGGTIKYYTTTTQLVDPSDFDGVSWLTTAKGTATGTYYIYYKIDKDGSGNYNDLEPALANRVSVQIVTPGATITESRQSGDNWIADVTFTFDNYSQVTCEAADQASHPLSTGIEDIGGKMRVTIGGMWALAAESQSFTFGIYLGGNYLTGGYETPH